MPGAPAFTRHLYIDRTPEEVLRFLAEPANAPQWMGGLWEARLEGGRPLDEGSRVTMRAEVVTRSPPASLVGPLAQLLLRWLDWGQIDRLKRVLDG